MKFSKRNMSMEEKTIKEALWWGEWKAREEMG